MQKDSVKKSILLLALHYYDDEEDKLLGICKNGVSAAHHTLLNNLISGLGKYCDVTVVSALPVGSFPVMSTRLSIRGRMRDHGTEIGYVNLPVIKDSLRRTGSEKAIREWVESRPVNSEKYILIYDAVVPFIQAASAVCSDHPEVISAIIIPDLPGEFSIENKSYGSAVDFRLRKKAERFYKVVNKIDGFIPLTSYMMDAMGLAGRPYMVMECITRMSDEQVVPTVTGDKHVVMYSGELSRNVDIDVLLDAVMFIQDDGFELWICGRGPMEKQIEECAESDPRIKYLGFVPKRELQDLQKDVNVFVNPRQKGHVYSKYSFPSKIAEYLISGKPVVAYKLEGIPDDYDEYLFYPESDSAQALASELERVLAFDQEMLQQISIAQKRFMDENKSAGAQAERIVSFLDSLR